VQLKFWIGFSLVVLMGYIYLEKIWKTKSFNVFMFFVFFFTITEKNLLFFYLLISIIVFLILVLKKKKDNLWLKMFIVSFFLFSISFLIFKLMFMLEYVPKCYLKISSGPCIGLQLNFYQFSAPNLKRASLLYLPSDNFLEISSILAINLKWYTPEIIGYYMWFCALNDILPGEINFYLYIIITP